MHGTLYLVLLITVHRGFSDNTRFRPVTTFQAFNNYAQPAQASVPKNTYKTVSPPQPGTYTNPAPAPLVTYTKSASPLPAYTKSVPAPSVTYVKAAPPPPIYTDPCSHSPCGKCMECSVKSTGGYDPPTAVGNNRWLKASQFPVFRSAHASLALRMLVMGINKAVRQRTPVKLVEKTLSVQSKNLMNTQSAKLRRL